MMRETMNEKNFNKREQKENENIANANAKKAKNIKIQN